MYPSPSDRPAISTSESRAPQERELDHRLANSLQLAVDFLGFQQQRTSDPTARKALEDAMARLAAVGELHRYLALGGARDTVELGGFLRGLCARVGQTTGLTCELRTEPVRVTAAAAQQIGLLVNECAINARKHAYGPAGGVLRIACSVLPGRLRLVVSDTGPGLAAGGSQGLGMGIIAAIVRQLGGAMAAESRDGARLTFLLPLAAPAERRSFAAWGEV